MGVLLQSMQVAIRLLLAIKNEFNTVGTLFREGIKIKGDVLSTSPFSYAYLEVVIYFLFRARSISTAIDTVAPTIGLLPIPRKPIISTCAGTEEEPAN